MNEKELAKEGAKARRAALLAEIAELDHFLNDGRDGHPSAPHTGAAMSFSVAAPVRKRKAMSKEARAKIAAAQRRRWAAQKAK